MSDRAVPFLLVALLLATSGTASEAHEHWFDTTPAEQKAFDALDSLTEVEFVDVPLGSALQELKSKYGVRTRISAETWRKLSALHRERAVMNRTLSGVTLRTTLRILLHDHGLGHYVDREGGIVITTAEEQRSRIVTRRYRVSRLVTPDASAEALAAVLHRLTAERPQSAKPRIGGFGNTLVVRANDAGHDEVDHLLTLIDEALKREQKGKASVSQTEKNLAGLGLRAGLQTGGPAELQTGGMPLVEVTKSFARAYDLNIVFDQRAMEKAGVSAKQPVSLVLGGVTLHEVLDAVLTPLNLGYVIQDEVIKITSRELAAEPLIRAVNVASLLEASGSTDALSRAIVDTVTEPLDEVVVFRDVLIIRGKPAAHLQIRETLNLLGRDD